MCSILGYFNTNLSQQDIEKQNLTMSHRGPDNSNVKKYNFKNKKLFLAHNRLSIQDLASHANQPMENERYVIVFNGEIYNHLEIRQELNFSGFKTHSDTETLLFSFSEFGIEKTLEKLNGMFAISLFDKHEQKMYLMRDRVGIKPLYYAFKNGEFAFSSELKGFSEKLKRKVSHKVLIQFLTLGYIPNDSSYYEDIKKLCPAHYLIFDGDNLEIKRYWDLPQKHINMDFHEALEKTQELIEKSVKYRLLSDVEVGTFLSGGVDSSLVTAIAQKHSSHNIKTFSIGFEDERYNESIYAKEVAKHLKTEHYEYKFNAKDVLDLIDSFDTYYDEPFGDASALPMMLLSKITKNKVTVALSGDGGDELFLGYDRYFLVDSYYKKFNKFPQFVRNIMSVVAKHSHHDKLEKISYPLKELNLKNMYSLLYSSVKPWEVGNIFDSDYIKNAFGKSELNLFDLLDVDMKFDKIEDFSRLDFYRYLPDDILTKVDRASMAHSLEARVPLLDHNVVELAFSLSADTKLHKGKKSILKEILYEHVPKDLIDRPKQGFGVPLKQWFKHELKDMLFDKIESLDERFNKKYILEMANKHVYKNRNYEYVFWNLMRIK